jgi:hypothetical protein
MVPMGAMTEIGRKEPWFDETRLEDVAVSNSNLRKAAKAATLVDPSNGTL